MKYLARLLILLLPFSTKVKAQEFFISAGDSIIKVNPTLSGCTYKTVVACAGQRFYSITYYRDTLYYIDGNNLYQAVVKDSTFRDCRLIATLPVSDATSLTVDTDGTLYFAYSTAFYKINPATGLITSLGNLPYPSAGDMVFYKNELYMASLDGIVKINLANPAASILFIPSDERTIFGLAVLSVDCNKNQVFAFSVQSLGTLMKEVDIENGQLGATACIMPFQVYDAASNVEDGSLIKLQVADAQIKPTCDLAKKGSLEIKLTPRLTRFYYSINGSPPSEQNLFTNLDPGDYHIQITTTGGCRLDTLMQVPSFGDQIPVMNVVKTNPTCIAPGKIKFSSVSDPSKFWIQFEQARYSINHEFSKLKKGNYKFDVWNQYDCKVDSFTIELSAGENCDDVYFPNAFTPDGDGKNDIFKPGYNYAISNFDVKVYNRWGQKVFSSTDMAKGWNGRINGARQGTEVYVWVAHYQLASGEKVMRKGTVLLIR